VTNNAASGDECVIFDSHNSVIGRGVYNMQSMYSVRVLARPFEPIFDLSLAEIVASRVHDALSLRRELLGLGRDENTTAYRLLNGEGDFLSGIVADVYNNVVVVECSAMWGEVHRSSIEMALKSALSGIQGGSGVGGVCVIWRSKLRRLREEGWTRPLHPELKAKNGDGSTGSGPAQGVVVRENGVAFSVCPGEGQKTGFYCDQRDNRLILRYLSAGMFAWLHPYEMAISF
jgi:23S rRNA (cytosine1962-C5)-methyltransferase